MQGGESRGWALAGPCWARRAQPGHWGRGGRSARRSSTPIDQNRAERRGERYSRVGRGRAGPGGAQGLQGAAGPPHRAAELHVAVVLVDLFNLAAAAPAARSTVESFSFAMRRADYKGHRPPPSPPTKDPVAPVSPIRPRSQEGRSHPLVRRGGWLFTQPHPPRAPPLRSRAMFWYTVRCAVATVTAAWSKLLAAVRPR